MRKASVLVAVATVLLTFMSMLVVGQTGELAEEQVLIVGNASADVIPLYPILSSQHAGFQLQDMIFDSLVRYKPGTCDAKNLEPALATSWEVSADGKVWTFYLRSGVEFQGDYGELTAEDVKFSLDRARSADTGSIWSNSLAGVQRIEAVDEHTRSHLPRNNGCVLPVQPCQQRTGIYRFEGGGRGTR